MVCWDLTVNGSLLLSTAVAVTKSHLPVAFLGQTEGTDGLFPQVRLVDKGLMTSKNVLPVVMNYHGELQR